MYDFLQVVNRYHSCKLLSLFLENRVFAFWRQTDRQTKCIGDDMKAAARQSPYCIKKRKKINTAKTIFNMADGIITPSNAARSWHWFRQVTAPCNAACGSWNMTVNSPSELQCDTWLWDDMPWNSRKRPPYWNSTSGFDFDHITVVDMSFCTVGEIVSISNRPQQKKWRHVDFSRWRISAILDLRGPIMGSLKSPCTTSYSQQRPSLNCLVFEKIAFMQFGDRQTNRRTDMDTAVAWSRSRCCDRRLKNGTVFAKVMLKWNMVQFFDS